MEISKVRVKVGDNEFEAEGTPDVVAQQLALWKELVEVSACSGTTKKQSPSIDGLPGASINNHELNPNTDLNRLFHLEPRKDLLSLRTHPTGDERDADAILLLVYGYRTLRELEEVPVTKLLESVRLSGLGIDRLDRAIAPHVSTSRLLKGGRGKGGTYRLTNTGADYASRLARELVQNMA